MSKYSQFFAVGYSNPQDGFEYQCLIARINSSSLYDLHFEKYQSSVNYLCVQIIALANGKMGVLGEVQPSSGINLVRFLEIDPKFLCI